MTHGLTSDKIKPIKPQFIFARKLLYFDEYLTVLAELVAFSSRFWSEIGNNFYFSTVFITWHQCFNYNIFLNILPKYSFHIWIILIATYQAKSYNLIGTNTRPYGFFGYFNFKDEGGQAYPGGFWEWVKIVNSVQLFKKNTS